MKNSSVPVRFLYRILIESYCEELHKRLRISKWIDPPEPDPGNTCKRKQ